jgi:hypothetical protein
LRCGLCVGLIDWGAAQHRPGHIRAQVFAAHQTVGGSLDLGAALCGHWTQAVSPLADSASSDTDLASKFGLAVGFEIRFKVHACDFNITNGFSSITAKLNLHRIAA